MIAHRPSSPVASPAARRMPAGRASTVLAPGVPVGPVGRVFLVLLGLALLGTPLVPVPVVPAAVAWDIDTDAPVEDLEEFHDHFSLAVYPYPRASAAPLGWVGFDVWAEIAVAPDFESEPFADTVVDGSLPADLLAVTRVGVRKGLPWDLDVGVSVAQVLDGDVDLISAELRWAVLEGSAVTPALGLRATATRSVDGGAYELEQYGLEAELSKGFAVLTPFVGAGVVWSESRFERTPPPPGPFPTPIPGDLLVDSTRGVVYGGVVLNLLVPKITFAVERGETWQGSVRLAIGL